ncbi:DUF3221 domain-containing protein [Bacillus sp. FJAT-53060]|uniref:DUF3221 domain-containing protein n=1 Tax=Bacillus TaxID=1386 RepID=UPI001CFB1F69|nr:DUF3221 domain-containing protein [Bacillus stratosphericus]
MISTKQKLATVATTLALGCGLTLGGVPAFAESKEGVNHSSPISSVQKQEQIPFTGYVISVDNKYMIVADTPTKEEALLYQNNWWELAAQGKILRVPISIDDHYEIGEKLNVFSKMWTSSIPPIAGMPTIERISE